MLARDVSNYTAALTPSRLAAWQAEGVGLVIVQAIEPPAGYPPGVTRQQLQACQDAGLPTDAYVYLWTNSDVAAEMQRKLALLDGYPIGRLWLDAEDISSASGVARRMAIHKAFDELDE